MPKNTKLAGQPVLCQLLSFVPAGIVEACVQEHGSDRYYKTMSTWKQLVYLLYGVVTRSHSLNTLCKNLLFLEDKLIYLGIDRLPAVSTLSDANIHRNSAVFASIYQNLCVHYQQTLSPIYRGLIEDSVDIGKVAVFDSSTITLFVDIFKGAGRNTLNGKKKGGLKVHAKMPLGGFVPDLVHLTPAACNDKSFLGQLQVEAGGIYIFDKGYAHYQQWADWTQKGAYYVTRLNENADYRVLSGQLNHPCAYAEGEPLPTNGSC